MATSDPALELIRDSLQAIRQDVSKVFDKLDDFVDANQTSHAQLDTRLTTLEHPRASRYGWVPTAAKIAWPALVIVVVLLRDATPETRKTVTRIAVSAAGLPDAAIGGMKQVASRFWSTSSVLPVMAANTWCFLVCDYTGPTNVMWTTNSSQTVSIRSGGSTYTTAVNSTLTDGGTNFFCNYRTMILIGPTVSSSSQCSVIVW